MTEHNLKNGIRLCAVLTCMTLGGAIVLAAGDPGSQAGTVCNLKVVSDKVPDVSSLEAWKAAYIREGMTDQEKAIAIWRSVITFQLQDVPPTEYLQGEDLVYDPIKMFNVYGYGMCSPHSAHMEALARQAGFQARGWGINHHSVNEFFYENAWHHFDSSLMCYFLKPDGSVAGVEDLFAAVKGFYAEHPDILNTNAAGRDKLLREFEFANGRTGWKKGPALIASSPQYNAKGWWPAGSHGWYATMQAFDGTSGNGPAFHYEYCASLGYRVNIQLRPGEKLVRNWSNQGLQVNMDGAGNAPGALSADNPFLKNAQAFCDKLDPAHPALAAGRVGNGAVEYEVPLADGQFRGGALQADNLAAKGEDHAGPAVHVKEAAQPAVLVLRMPSSYVYLGGALHADAVVGEGGRIVVDLSDNNGLDWKNVVTFEHTGPKEVDLKKLVFRRYDYRLRLTLTGKGTGFDALKITHPIQYSQRALPGLAAGENTIAFSVGPQESTVTVEASSGADHHGRQATWKDFHAVTDHLNDGLGVLGSQGSLTVPIATPGDMTALRMCACYRTWSDKDTWELQVSWDDGKTFAKVGDGPGQDRGRQAYVVVKDVPKGTRQALVRFVGHVSAANMLASFRVDADYTSERFGFRPVKITYVWDENGLEKRDEHIAAKPEETYRIACAAKPAMKSVTMEVAGP